MPQLQVIDIQEIKKVKKKKQAKHLYDSYTGYDAADYAIVFMDIESKKHFEIYVPARFKEMENNWFCIGEIWESMLDAIFEGDDGEDIFVYELDCEDKHWNLYYDEIFDELGEFNEEEIEDDFEQMDGGFDELEEDFEETEAGSYIIKTDKGYLKGDLRAGVEFVEKEGARIFSEAEIQIYWNSISDDLTDFFGIKMLEKEAV